MRKPVPYGILRDQLRVTRLGAAGAAMAVAASMMMTVTGCGAIAACGTVAYAGTPPGDGGVTSTIPAPTATGPVVVPGSDQARASEPAALTRHMTGTITLVTGDKVRVRQSPGGAVSAAPSGGGAAFVSLNWAGDQFMIPDEAVPFLGSVLDPRLFDVSYLARAGVSNEDGAVTITRSQASRLGGLLASAWRARGGTSAAGPSAASALRAFGQIRLAPPAGGPALPAPFPVTIPAARGSAGDAPAFHTVTLNFTGSDGKPAAAVGWLQNLDNAQLSLFILAGSGNAGDLEGVPGPLNVSVPAGDYSMQFTVLTPRQDTGSVLGADAALVVKPQVKVGSDQTLTFDARSAIPYQSSVTGGAANAPARVDWMNYTRISTTGGGCTGYGFQMGLVSASGIAGFTTANQLAATPTGKVTEGGLGFDAATAIDTGTPAPGSAEPRYYLDFPTQGEIPASLRYSVPFAKLTAVHQDVNDTPGGAVRPCPAELWPDVYQRWGAAIKMEATPYDEAVPGPRTDYWYTADPALDLWQPEFIGDDCVARYDTPRTLADGQPLTEQWNSGPAVPSAMAPSVGGTYTGGPLTADPRLTFVPAARQGNIGLLNLQPNGDQQASHAGEQFFGGVPSTLDFYRDGTLALSSYVSKEGDLDPSGLLLPMLPHPATYRLDWNQQRGNDPASSTDTDWTFTSAPGDAPATLPSTEACVPDPKSDCSFLPLLFINYHLALDEESQAPAGAPFQVGFSVSHQQGEAAPAGLSATVSASFDDGKTWSSPVDAARTGPGAFGLSIDQPPLAGTSGFASLRVVVHDGAGNSVTQTIIRAYGLS